MSVFGHTIWKSGERIAVGVIAMSAFIKIVGYNDNIYSRLDAVTLYINFIVLNNNSV